ncbi:MAG: MBL fold metallo-hydrolase, partial [Pseudomonadota bacterium]
MCPKDLELLAICMDIAIDEEEYEDARHIAETALGKSLPDSDFPTLSPQLNDPYEPPDDSVTQFKARIREGFSGHRWRDTIWAKYCRAVVMEDGSTCAMRHLDLSADVLLEAFGRWKEDASKDGITGKVAYLLEISHWLLGDAAISFARLASAVLEALPEECATNKRRYDSFSRLDQAIAHAHEGESRLEAVRELCDNIIRDFDESTFTNGWTALVYEPAVFRLADSQNKAQLAHHALQALNRLTNPSSDYKKRQKLIIEAEVFLELNELHRVEEDLKALRASSFEEIERNFANNSTLTAQGHAVSALLFDYYRWRIEEPTKDSSTHRPSEAKELPSRRITELEQKDMLTKLEQLCSSELLRNYIAKRKNDRISHLKRVAELMRWLSSKTQYGSVLRRFLVNHKGDINWLYSLINQAARDKAVRSIFEDWREVLESLVSADDEDSGEEDFLNNYVRFLKKQQGSQHAIAKVEQRLDYLRGGHLVCPCISEQHGKYWSNLLACKDDLPGPADDGITLKANHYKELIKRNFNKFERHLTAKSLHPYDDSSGVHFLGLQRWNSFTPQLAFSQGGGYLLYRTDDKHEVDLGIAIDPGFDYVENLFKMGFTLSDIDIVIISHAHTDHYADFEAIVSLLAEMKKRFKRHRRIHLITTRAVYQRIEKTITNPFWNVYLRDTYLFEELDSLGFYHDDEQGWSFSAPNSAWGVKITAKRSYHDDHSYVSDSYGCIVDIKCSGYRDKNRIVFGYTGDTAWHPTVIKQYSDCDVICMHMGSVYKDNVDGFSKFCKSAECKEC